MEHWNYGYDYNQTFKNAYILQELANAKGNILENKELLDSLNKMKASSTTVAESLQESVQLQTSLDQVKCLVDYCKIFTWKFYICSTFSPTSS